MEDSVLKNYQAELVTKWDNLISVTQPYADNGIIDGELRSIDSLYDKVKNAKPEIMFYGIYNAGKSSILNELLGSDFAKVDDVPTTDKIDRYEWNGYSIVDTPGVGAPIEHEKVTEAHLEHADVVLFVISDAGSHEYLENYRRLKAIAERGKKIIIVLNDKDGKLGGSSEDEQDLLVVKRQVTANAKAVGLSDDDYVILEVNADYAREGRIGESAELIKLSNIRELEKCILSELKRMPTFEILRRSILEIEKHLDVIITELDKGEANADIQVMNEFLEDIREEKKSARQEIISFIERRSSRMAKELPSIIWEHRSEGQEAINGLAQKYQDAFLQDVQKQMQIVLQGIFENLNRATDSLSEHTSALQMDSDANIPLPIDSKKNIPAVPAEQEGWKDKISNAAKELQRILEEAEKYKQYAVRDGNSLSGAVKTAGQGALMVPVAEQITKSIGKSVIGKALSGTTVASFLPSIPPIAVPIVFSLLKSLIFDDDDKRRREKVIAENEYRRRVAEAEAQARQDLQQRCLYASEDMADKIRLQMDLILNQIIEDLRRPIREQIETGKGEKKNRLSALTELRRLYEEYEAIRYELGAVE